MFRRFFLNRGAVLPISRLFRMPVLWDFLYSGLFSEENSPLAKTAYCRFDLQAMRKNCFFPLSGLLFLPKTSFFFLKPLLKTTLLAQIEAEILFVAGSAAKRLLRQFAIARVKRIAGNSSLLYIRNIR
ncbi:hypothetical protein FLCH110379_13080 [Flavobacterium chungbukense]